MKKTIIFSLLVMLLCMSVVPVMAIRDPKDDTEPSGGKIAFISSRDGGREVYVMDIDGSNVVRLTDNDADEVLPFWSYDGTKIGFTSDQDDDNNNLYVIDLESRDLYQMTPYNDGKTYSGNWSPDGSQLVYYSNFDGQWNIYYEVWGSGDRVQLTSGSSNYTPAFSPDGTQIAFMSERDGSPTIYLMDADGSNQHPLVSSEYREYTPQWSPDGSKIAFVVLDEESEADIAVVDRDGQNFYVISTPGEYDTSATWSPDGTQIMFQSNSGADDEIYIMDADGSNVIQITDNEVDDQYPRWQPGS